MKMTKNIKLTEEQAKSLYKNANNDIKELIVGAFGKKVLKLEPLTWVKTFEDIEEVLGHKVVLPFADDTSDRQEKAVNAFFKLQMIAKVFNEGWIPDFTNLQEQKWYPWWRKEAPSGWVFGCSDFDCDFAAVGFGLYFKNKLISDYVAANFKDIYIEYLPE